MKSYATDLEDIGQRLRVLERQNRRLKVGGLLTLILLSSIIFFMGARYSANVVRAERFVVVDERGKEFASFGLDNVYGQPVLRMNDIYTGKQRAWLGIDGANGWPELRLVRDGGLGERWAQLGFHVNELPELNLDRGGEHAQLAEGLSISDPNGHAYLGVSGREPRITLEGGSKKISLSCSPFVDGEAGLIARGDKGTATLQVGGRGPELLFKHPDGRELTRLWTDIHGSYLSLLSANGKQGASLYSDWYEPGLVLNDVNGTERVGVFISKGAPGLKTFDANQKVTWTAP